MGRVRSPTVALKEPSCRGRPIAANCFCICPLLYASSRFAFTRSGLSVGKNALTCTPRHPRALLLVSFSVLQTTSMRYCCTLAVLHTRSCTSDRGASNVCSPHGLCSSISRTQAGGRTERGGSCNFLTTLTLSTYLELLVSPPRCSLHT